MSTPALTTLSLPQLGTDSALASSTGLQNSPRLHKAAQQFEALLLGEMMKTVREGGSEGWLGSGDGTGDDTAVEMAESQFSQAMAANGGLGLAHLIERDISHQQDGQNEKASAE